MKNTKIRSLKSPIYKDKDPEPGVIFLYHGKKSVVISAQKELDALDEKYNGHIYIFDGGSEENPIVLCPGKFFECDLIIIANSFVKIVNGNYDARFFPAKIFALENTTVNVTRANSVYARCNAKVYAEDSSRVCATDSATVVAKDYARILAYDNANISGTDYVKVIANDNAAVTLFGKEAGKCYDFSSVSLFDNSSATVNKHVFVKHKDEDASVVILENE